MEEIFNRANRHNTRSQIVGDNEALPPDWSQNFRPSPLEALIFLDPIPEGPNSVRVTLNL